MRNDNITHHYISLCIITLFYIDMMWLSDMMSMASISEMRMRWQDNAFAAGLSTLSTCQNRAACQIDSHEKDPWLQKKSKKN